MAGKFAAGSLRRDNFVAFSVYCVVSHDVSNVFGGRNGV
jgi:hypothetical protein